MTTENLTSPSTIDKCLREEMNKLLHAKEIYEFDAYGWLNAETPDPDLIGHAMWQTDSLSMDVFRAIHTRQGSAALRLEPWQQFLAQSGGDLGGFMAAARLFIGLALFQHASRVEEHYAVDSFFQIYLIGAIVMLGAASERLRALLISAAFNKHVKEYEKGKKFAQGPKYVTPFDEVLKCLQDIADPLATAIVRLPNLATKIYDHYKTRNEIIHGVGTALGREERNFINNPPTLNDDDDHTAWEELTEEMLRNADQMEAERNNKRISDDLNNPIGWYQLLIDASNLVFIVENSRRRARDKPKG